MMNKYNEKTVVRTRRMPFRPAPSSDPNQSVNVLPVGTHLGEFEILDLIGEGGFGIVYLAYDHSLERHVALKEYMPSGLATRTTSMAVTVRSQHNAATFTAGLKSFINEARMLAQFDSPSLVKVHRFWEGNGTAYMVMPFYEGITLKRALKERRISPSEPWIRLLLADLFDAIETIHHAHCLHRDIAPDNILLLKDGRPLLLDFGAARRVIGDLTQCLTVILKPGFAPIEQYADIAGLRQGAWTDIYALAAVVYFLITGKAPPPAVARMVHDELVPAREAGKGRYSSAFLAVLDKALAVKPEQRFRSIDELRRALDIMDTVPRTLPRATSHWDITAVRTTRIADVKPDTEPEIKPDVKPNARPSVKPRIEPRVETPPPPRAQANLKQSVQPRTMYQTDEARPMRDKPAWLVLGLLLSAGIASGVYLGTHRSWDGWLAPSIIASDNTPAMESSGSSEAPQEELPDQTVATAPPAPEPAAPPSAPPVSSQPSAVPPATAVEPAAPVTPAARAPLPAVPVAKAPPPAAPAAKAPLPAVPAPVAKAPPPATNLAAAAPRTNDTASATKPDHTPSAPISSRAPSDEELWRIATKSDKSSAYQIYLDEYPKGRHASDAKLRLESKQPKIVMNSEPDAAAAGAAAAPKTTPPSAEEELWNTATGINEAPAYESYLLKYPKGRYAPLAKDKLASIKPAESAASSPPPVVDKPQEAQTAPADRPATHGADKLASIKPQEPGVPLAPKPSAETTPQPALEPAAPTPAAPKKRTLTVDDKTAVLTGDFTSDPKTGVVSGTGKVVWANGNQFEGTLVRGKKEGKGKFIWTNGQRYNGDWAGDLPNGKGAIVFADGSRYEGDVKDGVPHGHGTTRFKSGDVYSGAWVSGKSQGQGRYTWANGSYWEGEFKDDKRTENGKMVFSESALRAAGNTPSSATDGVQNSGRAMAD